MFICYISAEHICNRMTCIQSTVSIYTWHKKDLKFYIHVCSFVIANFFLLFLRSLFRKAEYWHVGTAQYGASDTVNIITQSVSRSNIGGGWCTPPPSLPPTPSLQWFLLEAPTLHESHHCVQVAQLNMTECIMTWKRRGGSFHLLIGSADYAGPVVKLLQGNGQWTHGCSPHTATNGNLSAEWRPVEPCAPGWRGQTAAAGVVRQQMNGCVQT